MTINKTIELPRKPDHKVDAAKIFGILNHNPAKWLGIGLASESLAQDNIEQLIEERNQARKSKDFEK